MPRYAPPVFVDPTGRRARLLRRLVVASVAVLSGLLGVLLMGLISDGPPAGTGWLTPAGQQRPARSTPIPTPPQTSPRGSSTPAETTPGAARSPTGQPSAQVVPAASPAPAVATPLSTRRPTTPPGSGHSKASPSSRPTPSPRPK